MVVVMAIAAILTLAVLYDSLNEQVVVAVDAGRSDPSVDSYVVQLEMRVRELEAQLSVAQAQVVYVPEVVVAERVVVYTRVVTNCVQAFVPEPTQGITVTASIITRSLSIETYTSSDSHDEPSPEAPPIVVVTPTIPVVDEPPTEPITVTPPVVEEDKPKCNQGLGNGDEGCDPGNSNHMHQSNDERTEDGKVPGNGGRKMDAEQKKDDRQDSPKPPKKAPEAPKPPKETGKPEKVCKPNQKNCS
jgi:outer membrane biosynthesis protein TonB